MSYGDGTIINRGRGKWEVAIDFGINPDTGKRDRVSKRITGKKADARKLRDQLRQEYENGIASKAYKETLSKYLAGWLDSRKKELAHTTFSHYRNSINKWIVPYFKNVAIADVTPQMIKNWHKRIKNKGASDLTVKQAHKTLKTALKEAVFEGTLTTNPADRVRTPKAELAKRGYLAPEEISRMIETLNSMEETGFTMAVRIGIATGARRGEVLGLQWQDLNKVHGTLYIQRSLVQVDGAKKDGMQAKEYKKPKTASGTRKISLDRYTLNKLLEWKEQQAVQLDDLGLKQDLETPICCSLYGAKIDGVPKFAGLTLDPSKFTTVFHEFCKEHGFYSTTGKLLCFHELRHAAASILLSHGLDVVTVAGRLGHSSPSITEDLYSHFMPERDQDCADAIEGVILGQKQEKIIKIKSA